MAPSDESAMVTTTIIQPADASQVACFFFSRYSCGIKHSFMSDRKYLRVEVLGGVFRKGSRIKGFVAVNCLQRYKNVRLSVDLRGLASITLFD